MTREEAIHILNSLKPTNTKSSFDAYVVGEAITMAIKALEQEPKEITLEDVKGYCKPRCLTIISNELLYELTHPKIKALEQEPKTGHWMKSNIGGAKVCSVCNAHMGLSSFKYCPNCGADMRGEEE